MAAVTGTRADRSAVTDIRRVDRRSREYPVRLHHLTDPPECLWATGPLQISSDRMVAVVGTRRATEYGRRTAEKISWGLAAAGWTVVSGLARGIDAAAHRGALDAEGRTLAVLGCGVDRVYPATNRDLRRRIARSGALVSEFEPGTPPLRHHFPQRNRIIAALARAVVVVQAGEPSGALITADMALDLGREVLAVPGPVDQAVSCGVHRLLREGAGLVTSAQDVFQALGERDPERVPRLTSDGPREHATRAEHGAAAGLIRACLEAGPAGVEEICQRLGISLPGALAALGSLEIAGIVRALPGQRYELAVRW